VSIIEEKSSYLKYLPPVLWQDDPPMSELSLGTMLRIFEKILTGIPDGHSLPHDPHKGEGHDGYHEHGPITAQIAQLHRLFDPWTTPEEFLPWLASWVALEFPTLQDVPLWDEYQRRKVTSTITQIHRLRGRKAGLNKYLDLYAVGRTRPRVALDDGNRLLAVTPSPGAIAPVVSLVSQGPVVTPDGSVRVKGLTRPQCVAVGSDGGLLVGDIALPSGLPVQLANQVWQLDPAGQYHLAGTPPQPQPIAPGTLTPLTNVVAVAVRPPHAATPETLYVLDQSQTARLYAIPAPFQDSAATQVTSLAPAGTTIWPVAMAVDPGNGDLLVLDRGDVPGAPSAPRVITVRPSPLAVTRTALRTVAEPLSLAAEPDGTLLVGDGGNQMPDGPAQFPGNLVSVDRSTTPWTETPLLPDGNPLVAPTGIARTRDGRLYVLDAGLKPFTPTGPAPFICDVAEDAGVYRVDLAASPPSAERISELGQLVYPTGMAATEDRLVICDPGQPPVAGVQPFWSRVRPFQVNVVIHFARSRLPPDEDAQKLVIRQARGNVQSIIEAEKPAHTLWNLITETPD
jgi:phage tail-like protein